MLDSKKLKEVRNWLQFSQEELGDAIWVTAMTIFRYEAEKCEINLSNLKKIVDVFNGWKKVWDFEYKAKVKYSIEDFVK